MNLSKTIFNLLIVLVVLVLLYFGYGFFKGEATPPPAPGLDAAGFGDGNSEPSPADEFLTTLTGLQELNLRGDLFANPVFKDLQESTTVLPEGVPGRPNPFAPVNFATLSSGSSASGAGTATTSKPSGGSALERLRAN